jgi:lipid A ethanolaminephosphotransferase
VTACGSSTEVSLPCMFSPYGRRDYDEGRIRNHQSLLHVLDHAGIATLWRDNQSGCKGVCDGLPVERLDNARDADLCNGKRCLDEILLKGLQAQLSPVKGDRVVVLHQLGNHGPNYFERYPPAFKRFTPTCDNPELGQCEREHIVNAYDNALLYTDHVLAQAIGFLGKQTEYDAALIYVSDHGESLGEKGLFLHGMPYSIAPQEQTRVPMVMWFSPGFVSDSGLDLACLRREAAQPASHDNLFPSVLGLLQVRTDAYRRDDDLFATCRSPV